MLISKFGNNNPALVSEFCKKENIPKELKAFLEKYNGGETPETTFSSGTIRSDIVGFYGVGNVKYSYNDIHEIQDDDISYLPIAFDSFGNQIAVSKEDGDIIFWDHEKGKISGVIANSFKEFLNCTESKPISPGHLKSIEQRENELISRGKGSNITEALRDLWRNEIDKYSNMHQEPVEF